jgi:hypothetical protein
MKTNYLYPFLTVILLLINGCGQAQTKSSDEQAIKILNEFYSNYIIENSKSQIDQKTINSLKSKYCTSRLLNKIKIEDLDYDPFLNAQDCDAEWLKTLTITRDSRKPNFYIISFVDNLSNKKNYIRLSVIKEKDTYKIDTIL